MDTYIAFIIVTVLLSPVVLSPIARYLTGYSWPAAILLIFVSAIVFSLIGPLLTLPYFQNAEVGPTIENYLKLYATYVFIKTVVDTFFLQLTTTMFFSSNPNIAAPPFSNSFMWLFIANLGVMGIVAGLYVYNLLPALTEAIGITVT